MESVNPEDISIEFEQTGRQGITPTVKSLYDVFDPNAIACGAKSAKQGWICTRPEGHEAEEGIQDYHEAGSEKYPDRIFARWKVVPKKKGWF